MTQRHIKKIMPLESVEAWVFDLDNTLYPPSAGLFAQIDPLMTRFISDALGVDAARADTIRRDTWSRYGATLTGLMTEHGVDPAAFLEATHQLDLSMLAPDPALITAISRLPGEKLIHTNGPRAHADRVLAARGLKDLFPTVIAIEDTDHVPKPQADSTLAMLRMTGLDPARAVMIEDQPANLAEPHRIGMTTVLVSEALDAAPHVDHVTPDLTAFLGGWA